MKNRGDDTNKKRAFTLIEMLIVISIISIITVFILVSVRSSQSRSRDTSRATDLGVLNNAIQMYYRETGHFPSLPDGCGTNISDYGWINSVSTNQVDAYVASNTLCNTGEEGLNFIQGLTPSYTLKLPLDPGPKNIIFGKNVRGYMYYRYLVGTPSNLRECYKILLMFPENPSMLKYQNIWDPSLDQGSDKNELDGTNIGGWSYYSQGCAAKNPIY